MFTLQKRNDLYNYQQFLPSLLWNNNIREHTSSYIGFTHLDYYIPLYRYSNENRSLIAAFKSFINYSYIPSRTNGYRGLKMDWNNDLAKARAKTNYIEIKIDTLIVKSFEKFINECISQKINLTLTYTPEYIEGQQFVENRKEIIDKYQYFANKYNLQFLDYSANEICMQRDLFYNASHLNKKGAEIFTKKLIKDVKFEKQNLLLN
jgi:hypothetical protein